LIPLVMAGGLGTRARPLSANRPKPLLPIVNRPVLARVLDHLLAAGFAEAAILTFHEEARIREALARHAPRGLALRFVHADRDLGSAGAVARAVELFGVEECLAISADIVCNFDLADLVAFHRERGAAATIALTRVANPLQFGIVIVDSRGRVLRFLEKPTWGEVFSDTVNAGIFVLSAGALSRVPRDEPVDFAADLFPRLLADGAPLYGCVQAGYWRDIGDPDTYLAVHADVFAGRAAHLRPGGAGAGEPRRIDPGAEVDPAAELRGTVVIGPGCRIAAGVRLEDVVLGTGTRVAARADLRRTVTWDGVVVGEGARVEGAVLCDRVTVGPESVVESGAIVADATVLGREVRVKEGVRIWSGKLVEDHAVVHSNLVYAERWRTSAFEEGAVTGLTNLELTPEVAARLGAAYGTLLPPGATVLSTRDAHPASRMLRRAFFGGVGSSGVNLVDLGMLPLPVMRHKLESFGEVGGVAFHQVQLVRGMTSIRFFDDTGLDISTAFAKSVERVFLREEFRRVQHHQIGVIFESPRIVDFYAEGYLRAIPVEAIRGRRFRLVVDYAHSAAVVILPRLLAQLGCDVVTLNAHTDGVHEALLAEEIEAAQGRLAAIVRSLEADLGVLLYPGAERLALVDGDGRVWSDVALTALAVRGAAGAPPSDVALPAYAPSTFVDALNAAGHRAVVTMSSSRALTEASRQKGVLFATAGKGDFIFPALHHAPDAMFAVGMFLAMLARAGQSLAELGRLAPAIPVASRDLPCPPDRKGEVMRRFAERLEGRGASLLDGVKAELDGGWIMLCPDRAAPVLHLHAEAANRDDAAALLAAQARVVEDLLREG
jgi:mannose-1-phosphate guanylyltransferase/phosphomannomutase